MKRRRIDRAKKIALSERREHHAVMETIVSPFEKIANDNAEVLEEEEEEEYAMNDRSSRMTKATVDEALEEIRYALINDGGNVEVVAVAEEDGIVAVRLLGNCSSCASSEKTMKLGVEAVLRKRFGQKFKEVVNVSGDVGSKSPELTKIAVEEVLLNVQARVRSYGGSIRCLEVDGRRGNVVLGFQGPKALAAATAQSLKKTFPFIKTAELKEIDDDD